MALMLSLKVFLISIAVLFTALGLKVYVPLLMEFFSTHMSVMCNFFSSCFKPPYLYVVMNVIIITIVVSSKFYHSAAVDEEPERTPPPPKTLQLHAYETKSSPVIRSEISISEPIEEPPLLELKAVVVNGSVAVEDEDEDEDKKVINDMESAWTRIKKLKSTEIPSEIPSPVEKPSVSSRFSHRKPPKANPEGGKSLGVAKPKRHETLENTWKMITEGRPMPLSRHMKKCDTWQSRGREINLDPVETTLEKVKKSETFRDRPQTKLRKEPSLSQDELNRRVEAFIRKFNEEMRLQRQESLNEHMQMINRGTN